MTISRHTYDISTDTGGDFTDTGPPVYGMVLQMRYETDTGATLDTGADIKLETVTTGVVVADYDNVGGSSFTRIPSVEVFDTGGDAAGDQYPIVSGEQLRCTVTQSAGVTGSKAGKLHVWTGW